MTVLFLLLFVVLYPYLVFPLVLKVISFFHKEEFSFDKTKLPPVTVYLSALNEETKIEKRLDNIRSVFANKLYQVIVISDGSTDNTAINAKNYAENNPDMDLLVIELEKNRGRAHAQNLAAKQAKYEILLATDAETVFLPDFAEKILLPFTDPKVGVTGVALDFKRNGLFGLPYQLYNQFEVWLRKVETFVGLCVKTNGPVTAYRKKVWVDIEDFEDVDQSVHVLAQKQKLKTYFVPEYLAHEVANSSSKQELKARSRMTRKSFLSILHRVDRTFMRHNALFTFVLWSHKLSRFFSSIAILLTVFWVSILLAFYNPLMFFILFTFGFLACLFSKKLRTLLVAVGSTFLAHLIGFIGYLRGDKTGIYKPANN